MYEVLFSDWFIINIKEHTNMTDLYNLKLTNKYFYKNITKKDLEYCITKTVKKVLVFSGNNKIDIITRGIFTKENGVYKYPLNIPINTYFNSIIVWKYTDRFKTYTHLSHYIIKNIFGKLIIKQASNSKLKISYINNKIIIQPIDENININTPIIKFTQINF